MAYKLKDQKIIPGGLNLLAPGDQVAEGDCLELKKWWSGAAGRLEQAPSAAVRNNPAVISTQDSLCQADGRIYYGGGGNLRQIGRAADAPIDTGYNGDPLGMISYQGHVWVMNKAKQRKDDGTTTSDWTPAPPGVPTLTDGGVNGAALIPAVGNPPEVGGLFAQEYSYYVTWQLGTLGETNPSTVAGVITPATITPAVDGSIVRVTQPAGAPANATGWNIYRKGPNLITPYQLNENVLDISRTYVDDYGDAIHTHSDDDLLRLGIIMETNHDAAPACKVIANQVYNGRMVVANSTAHPNRIWFTQALQPGFFRNSANENGGDWVDIGTDKGDEILAMTVRPGMVIIYRSRSIWRHVGDFGDLNARVDPMVPDQGIAGVRSVASTSLGDFFVGADGVYKYNGDWAQKVSTKVERIFRGLAVENFGQMDTAYRSKCAIGYRNGRLWVSYPAAGGASQAGSLIYHAESQRWFNDGIGYGAFLDTGTEFLGAGPGVYSLESQYDSTTTLVAFQSEYQDCSLPDREKTFADLVISHNTAGQTLTITIRTNKNSGANDSFVLTTITSSVLTPEVIPLVYPAGYAVVALRGKPIRARNLSVRITGNGQTTTPIIIDSPMILHYYVEARKGKRFDTSMTDHGTQDAKIVDQVEIDIDATDGDASLQVSSDIPGGTMATRLGSGQAITASTGRESRRMVLSSPATGKLLRYEVTTTTGQQIYGMRARVLPIGVYLDGTVSDFWQPTPISIGV